jgi:hypothetical protein
MIYPAHPAVKPDQNPPDSPRFTTKGKGLVDPVPFDILNMQYDEEGLPLYTPFPLLNRGANKKGPEIRSSYPSSVGLGHSVMDGEAEERHPPPETTFEALLDWITAKQTRHICANDEGTSMPSLRTPDADHLNSSNRPHQR